ncbi:MAG: hypothetical protein WBW84_17305 [Acidobacteriaceae bacterium]
MNALVARLPEAEKPNVPDRIFAVDLNDGGMGSIRLVEGADDSKRRMGRELVSVNYTDEDQIPVLISLNVDERGHLFEIDIWKVNFRPLLRYPGPDDLRPEK